MRIVTWNCCRGDMAKKIAAVRELNPDVLLLQEATPKVEDHGGRFLSFVDGIGIATLTFNGYEITEAYEYENRCGLGTTVRRDDEEIDVVNIWTHPRRRYVDSALGVIDATPADRFAVFAGDFNANATFRRGYDQLLEAFERRGCHSAYHAFHGTPHGEERHPTHYWRRREGSPFHLDYCFLPRQTRIIDVHVGEFDEWSALSDHRPLTVNMTLPRGREDSSFAN